MFSLASLGDVDEVAVLHVVVDVGAGVSKNKRENLRWQDGTVPSLQWCTTRGRSFHSAAVQKDGRSLRVWKRQEIAGVTKNG